MIKCERSDIRRIVVDTSYVQSALQLVVAPGTEDKQNVLFTIVRPVGGDDAVKENCLISADDAEELGTHLIELARQVRKRHGR